VPIFVVCGLAYVTALAIIHLLAPRIEPVVIDDDARVLAA
jgi:hypothetical protein